MDLALTGAALIELMLLGVLTLFGIHRLSMARTYYRLRGNCPKAQGVFESLPRVSVQLPLYNEPAVCERLIRACAALDYPRDRFEIQILDDSNDETSAIAEKLAAEYREAGIAIEVIRRKKREGFKAGALQYGLERCTGEFVAIFDADFVPPKDFLHKSIHHFSDLEVGMVQHRWGHLNSELSLLTKAQRILLDGHFLIEHTARHRSGVFFNFNGTAGVWRKSEISRAGGWQGDTLTEDLDLSYRAQLGGCRFVYLVESVVPAELPPEIDAFKSQQHRWTKGSIQVLRKLGPQILKADTSWRVKREAFFHLGANVCYPIMLIVGLLLLPSLIALESDLLPSDALAFIYRGVFGAAFFSIVFFYSVASREANGHSWLRAVSEVPIALTTGIALSLSNSLAVFEALLGTQTPFNRTPKTGSTPYQSGSSINRRRIWRPQLIVMEGFLTTYFGYTWYFAASHARWESLFFISLYFAAFAFFFIRSTTDAVKANLASRREFRAYPLPAS